MLLVVLLALAAFLALFSWWGLRTRAGAARFDEMAGMIPVAAGALSGVLVVVSAGVWWFRAR